MTYLWQCFFFWICNHPMQAYCNTNNTTQTGRRCVSFDFIYL